MCPRSRWTAFSGRRPPAPVRAWQSHAGLAADGVVGRLTWDSLYTAAQQLQNSGPVVRVATPPLPSQTLRRGDRGIAVLRLSQLLLFLAQWLPEINFLQPTVPSADFTAVLENAVRSAQQYFGLPQTGAVATADWEVFREEAQRLAAVNPAAAAPEPAGIWPPSGLSLGSAGPAVMAAAAQPECRCLGGSRTFSLWPEDGTLGPGDPGCAGQLPACPRPAHFGHRGTPPPGKVCSRRRSPFAGPVRRDDAWQNC